MEDALTPTHRQVPDKPTVDGLEERWMNQWDKEKIYRFNRDATRESVYSIDTPPPTVSGTLHIGHVFSYTHPDVVARFWRMRGKDVFYPMGWDDNGLPTERRVENFYGVRCDPALPYDPKYRPPEKPGKNKVSISRKNFVELCVELTATDEVAFKNLWRAIGVSVDWGFEYSTISKEAQTVSQRGFLQMLTRGEVYSAEAPTLWDIDFRTAVSQAELEDRERPGAYHRVAFDRADNAGTVDVDTTRPELLASCVALVAHPEDERYRPLLGTSVVTPLFGVEVPILAHELADPEKGTGIAMICTFGDTTDVVWWRELNLPTRAFIGRDGRFLPADFADDGWSVRDAELAQEFYDREMLNKTVNQARAGIVDALRSTGALIGDVREITHPVKFYEKGERPLEIVTSRQWFVRTLEHRDELLARGEELRWHPDYMRHRYRSWVEGLNVDWNISRQRFFGVPFPAWYPVDENGEIDFDHLMLAHDEDLPVDPSSDVPAGFTEDQRGVPGGFVGDPDVMDTWATSSLSPQIAGQWGTELFQRVFPMDLRPQAHDIIRTWLFATIVRSHFQFDSLPFSDTLISGFILDPDRKKMSKSIGNTVTPMPLIEQFGADALRYWAAGGRPGADTAFDEGQLKIGRRLGIKILNASKFVLGRLDDAEIPAPSEVTEPIDLDLLAMLAKLITAATDDYENYDYARALERSESFFWSFCDDYVELVKIRAYGEDDTAPRRSARATLAITLSVLQRLFAPIMPFVTDEVWHWWHQHSVHAAPWPTLQELPTLEVSGAGSTYGPVCEVLEAIRRAKSSAKVSQRAEVASVMVRAPAPFLASVALCQEDLMAAGGVTTLTTREETELSVEVVLADSQSIGSP
jgi:valyl-tRNA synthetase